MVFYVTAVQFSLSPPASVCWGQLWLVAGQGLGEGVSFEWLVREKWN